jgi:hypothetical protein
MASWPTPETHPSPLFRPRPLPVPFQLCLSSQGPPPPTPMGPLSVALTFLAAACVLPWAHATPASCSLRAQGLTVMPNLQAYNACTSLDLSANWLTAVTPAAFAALPSLVALQLSNNSLAALDAAAFSGLTALQVMGALQRGL